MNVLCFVLALLIISFVQAQIIELTVDKTIANPGETIIFTIKENHQGQVMERREFTFDGHKVPWSSAVTPETPELTHKEKIPWIAHNDDKSLKDGALNYVDTVKWTATSGTHVLRLYVRWRDENNKRVHLMPSVIVQVSGWQKEGGYIHPGLNLTAESLDKIKKNISGEKPHPMKKAWKNFNPDLNYTPTPWEELDMSLDPIRKAAYKRNDWDRDRNMAYECALKWAIDGDPRYAAKAVEILNAWSHTCRRSVFDNQSVYQFLHGTNSMAKWLYAAELLKHHDGGFADWSQEAKKIFDEEYVRKLLVPLSLGWPGNIDPYACQNQYVYVADARMALGIYLDDKALFNSGYHYLTKKNFICSLNQEIFGHDPASMLEYVIGPNGQFMEINRDMGHTKMCMTATMQIAEMLWSQGYDLYGTILYGDTTPRYYQGMRWLVKGKFDKVESYLRGAQKLPSIGPYEKYYNHFRYRLKNKYPVPADLERYVFEQRKSGNYNDFLYMELDNKTLPEAPSDLLAASPVWYQVELSWKDNAYNETCYQIVRSSDGENWQLVACVSPADVSYIDENVSGSTKYWYRIRAENVNGKSAYTNVQSVKTAGTPNLGKPLGLNVEIVSSNTLVLSWFVNSSSEKCFDIERSIDGNNWKVITTVNADVTSYTDNEASPSTKYFYRVQAKNKTGSSEYSDTVSVITFGDGSNSIVIEAESGDVSDHYYIETDENGITYIEVVEPYSSTSFVPGKEGQIKYEFNIPAANTYYIWGFCNGLKGGMYRSFWLKMDSEKWFNWNNITKDGKWRWYFTVNGDVSRERAAYFLHKGKHVLTLAYRQIITRLDKLIITDDPDFNPNVK